MPKGTALGPEDLKPSAASRGLGYTGLLGRRRQEPPGGAAPGFPGPAPAPVDFVLSVCGSPPQKTSAPPQQSERERICFLQRKSHVTVSYYSLHFFFFMGKKFLCISNSLGGWGREPIKANSDNSYFRHKAIDVVICCLLVKPFLCI